MPPSTFSEAWGGVVICFLVSAVLNGCIIVQGCSYFSKFQSDPLVLKSAAAVICLSTILHFCCEFWMLHNTIVVLGYDRPFDAVMVPIGFSITIALEVIIHCTVQGAYIFRMYRFGKNPYILASCCVLVLVELSMGFVWVGRVAITGPVSEVHARNEQLRWVITCFFTLSAFVDVFITASVSYQLRRSRMTGLKRTKRLIDKIMQWTIPTGMLTSAVAILIVVLWDVERGYFRWFGICAVESDCYAAGLLALLNARRTRYNTKDSDHLSISMPGYPSEASPGSSTARTTMVCDLSAPSRDHLGRQDASQDVHKLQSSSPGGDLVLDLNLLSRYNAGVIRVISMSP